MQCLRALDAKIADHSFMCGEKLTFGDIVIFNDLSLFMELMELTPESEDMQEFENLMKWMKSKMLNNMIIN